MTATLAETALWRALNPKPRGYGPDYERWLQSSVMFPSRHPADRLAYFEGKVRERGLIFQLGDHGIAFVMRWHGCPDYQSIDIGARAPTELDARFHASARALAALGVVDDDLVKEISDGD